MNEDVPTDAPRCPHCGEPFPTERLRDLHVGYEHEGVSDDEREAFETAYRSETDDIRRFRLKVVGALVLLYFGLLFVYVGVT